jgi:hypothetical protein
VPLLRDDQCRFSGSIKSEVSPKLDDDQSLFTPHACARASTESCRWVPVARVDEDASWPQWVARGSMKSQSCYFERGPRAVTGLVLWPLSPLRRRLLLRLFRLVLFLRRRLLRRLRQLLLLLRWLPNLGGCPVRPSLSVVCEHAAGCAAASSSYCGGCSRVLGHRREHGVR